MEILDNEYKETILLFLNFWKDKGFSVEDPISIVDKGWDRTLFVNSGLIKYLIKIKESGRLDNSMTTCQPCVKLGTSYYSFREMLAKDGYFTYFSQLSCCANRNISLAKLTRNIVEYLSNTFDDFKEKIVFGVSGNNPRLNDILLEQGIRADNIVFPDNGAFTLNIDNVIQGRYNSFYYDRGERHPLACGKTGCDINCACGRYLEIGDIGLVRYQNIDFFEHGIGLERLYALSQKKVFVVDIFEFKGLFDIINGYLKLDFGTANLLTDNFRTAFLLLSCGILPGNKNQNYSTRFLLRKIFWALNENGKIASLENNEMLYRMLRHSANYFFLDEKKKGLIVSEITKEKTLFERMLKNSNRVVRKLQKAGKTKLSEAELQDIYETYGIPAHVMKKLLSS